MSYSGDIEVPSIRDGLHLEYLVVQYFSVDSHFTKNDKSYSRRFFHIDGVDDGLSFPAIESISSPNIFGLLLYTIFRRRAHVDKTS